MTEFDVAAAWTWFVVHVGGRVYLHIVGPICMHILSEDQNADVWWLAAALSGIVLILWLSRRALKGDIVWYAFATGILFLFLSIEAFVMIAGGIQMSRAEWFPTAKALAWDFGPTVGVICFTVALVCMLWWPKTWWPRRRA